MSPSLVVLLITHLVISHSTGWSQKCLSLTLNSTKNSWWKIFKTNLAIVTPASRRISCPPYISFTNISVHAFAAKMKRAPGNWPPPLQGRVHNEFYHHSVAERIANMSDKYRWQDRKLSRDWRNCHVQRWSVIWQSNRSWLLAQTFDSFGVLIYLLRILLINLSFLVGYHEGFLGWI